MAMPSNRPSTSSAYNRCIRKNFRGVVMTDFSIAAIATTESVEDTHDHSLKTIALFCCAGLLTSLCLMAFGIDMGATWI